MKLGYWCLILALVITCFGYADLIHVPGDYPTIQAGIDAAADGNTVLVADGIYFGEGNRDLDFKGKAITVTSENGAENCIIICDYRYSRGFYFHSGETSASIVNGFTITGGGADNGSGIYCSGASPRIQNNYIIGNDANDASGITTHGGGIYCHNSSSIIINNIIAANHATYGGGICCYSSSPTIIDNTISENLATKFGAGIYCNGSSAEITNNTITSNSTSYYAGGIGIEEDSLTIIANNMITNNRGGFYGGGICFIRSNNTVKNNIIAMNYTASNGGGIRCDNAAPTIINNTIVDNFTSLGTPGGGISCVNGSRATILNTILWANTPDEIHGSEINITYSDIQGGWIGEGNIDDDPLFVDPDNGDYHLQAGSPCIDAGDPNSPKDPDGTRADIGAFYYDQSIIPVPTTLEKVSGDNQSGDVGNVLPNPLVVRVLDQNSETMAGVIVNFEPSEGASVNPTQAMTNENGEAQTILTLGTQPGEYNVTASVEGVAPVVFTATAIGVPVLIVDAGEDNNICHPNNDGSTQIGGNPTPSGGTEPYTYSWDNAGSLDNASIANPTATPTTTTTYTVNVNDSSEPPQEASDSVTITVNPELIADAGENTNIAPGGSSRIGGNPTASGGTAPYTYNWTPTESLDDASIANPIASPIAATTYTVIVTDDNGCEDTDEMTVTVVEGLYATITYPVDGAYIRGEIVITGTVLGGANGLKSWLLKQAKSGGGQYKTINYGDYEINNGELGRWDTTNVEGEYMLRLTAIDNEDNERVQEIAVNVDNTNPVPIIQLQSDGASGDWTKDYTELYVSGEVEAGAQLIEAHLVFEGGFPFTDYVKENIGIDGTGRIAGTIPDGYNLSENNITTVILHLKCKDRAGNEGEGMSNILYVDNEKPTVTIQNPASDANFNIFQNEITIAGIATDVKSDISRAEVNLYDGSGWLPVEGTTNWQYHYYQHNEVSVVTIHARSIDNAGNASEVVEIKFHCIWDFPSVNLSSPVDNSTVSGVVEIVGLVWDSDHDDSDLQWSVDYGIGEHKISNIASGYRNKDGTLCYWDTRTLDTEQVYTLFLTVSTASTMANKHRFDYYVNAQGEVQVKRYNISVTETLIIYGDVNDDGKVTPHDASLVMRHVVGVLTLNSDQLLRAEVTHDGTLSSMDATLILQRITGLIPKFPVEMP